MRLNVVPSDDLDTEIGNAAADAETSKSGIIRRAIQLFLVTRDGKLRGRKLGLVEPKSETLRTDIVGP